MDLIENQSCFVSYSAFSMFSIMFQMMSHKDLIMLCIVISTKGDLWAVTFFHFVCLSKATICYFYFFYRFLYHFFCWSFFYFWWNSPITLFHIPIQELKWWQICWFQYLTKNSELFFFTFSIVIFLIKNSIQDS